jgi:hypothetical protein
LYPWGWTGENAPNASQLSTLAHKLAYFNSYQPGQANSLYITSGTNEDWVYGDLGVASYVFEMGTFFFESCENFQAQVSQNRSALLYAFKAARQPYLDPAGPEVIDVVISPVPSLTYTLKLSATASALRYAPGQSISVIAAARYSFDTPSWVSGTITYTLGARDGILNSGQEELQAVLDLHRLKPGQHLIFVEAQDQNGHWGVPSAQFFDVPIRLLRRNFLPLTFR